MARRFEYDEFGEHSTRRKMVCVTAKPHMRAVLSAIIDYARSADLTADRLTRQAVALGSRRLFDLAQEYRAKSRRADYLLGLNEL